MRWIVMALAAGALTAAPAHAAFPGTNGKLAAAGLATQDDIYTLNADGTGITPLVPHPNPDSNPAWSPNGKRIAFDSARNGSHEIFVMDADGGNLTQLTNSPYPDQNPYWSPDGTRIVFESTRAANNRDLWVMNADGSSPIRLTTDPAEDRDPAWSPDGTKIAFASNRESYACEDPDNPACYVRPTFRIFTIQPDRTNLALRVSSAEPTDCTNGVDVFAPDWSPNGASIAFESIEEDYCQEGYVHVFATSGPGGTALHSEITDLVGAPTGSAWSPDGREVVLSAGLSSLKVVRSDGTEARDITGCCYRFPSWQPQPGYARPKHASPIIVSLVPAYARCLSPNRTHGPPLASASCNLPVQRSGELTVGTPDANGLAVTAIGYTVVLSRLDDPGTPVDEADVRFRILATDVRRRSDLSEYSGELQARLTLRITDKDNTPVPGVSSAATVQDFPFMSTVPCVAGRCEMLTGAEALVPGSVTGGRRAIWQLGPVELYDGGPDGDADTQPNAVFAVQGVFVP